MISTIIIFAFIFIIGLCIGSFLNVVILRGLSGESIVYPASKCPKCQHPLYWWHNIPLLSYILLKGKCGFCKEKISIQYPIIELLTGLLFIGVVLKYGLTVDALFGCIIVGLFVVIATTDFKEKVVLDTHTYGLILTGILYNTTVTIMDVWEYYSLMGEFNFTKDWIINNHFVISVLGLILGFVIMEAIARLGYLIAGNRAFGEGDSFIAAGLGAVFGWKILLAILAISVVIQLLITLPIFIKKEIEKKNKQSLISLTAFFGYTAIFFTAQYFGLLTNGIVYIISVIILLILGIYAIKNILNGIKNPENQTYLPFGPALILAGLIIILF